MATLAATRYNVRFAAIVVTVPTCPAPPDLPVTARPGLIRFGSKKPVHQVAMEIAI